MNTTTGTIATHTAHGRTSTVRVVAVQAHPDGYDVARVVDARMVSNRGGVWVRLSDLTPTR